MQSQLRPPAQFKRKHKVILLTAVIAAVAVVVLFTIGMIVYQSYLEYQNSPKLVEGAHPDASAAASYNLSADQAKIVAENGNPDSFTILFYKEEFAPDYDGEVRDEIWRYYGNKIVFSFYNGVLVNQETIDNPPASWVPLPYQPGQFTAYAGLKTILASASIQNYFELPLEKELVNRGKLYYAPGLTFGTVSDRLIYVETISMKPEGEE